MSLVQGKNDAILWDKTAKSPALAGICGRALIQELVKNLPNKPGVYRMFDQKGEVLYVGKARNLKKRVSNYARDTGHSQRILRMINATADMEFIVTHTETEALLLEANLIKRLHPRFNILLRDDKSFPYIAIADSHRAPGIFKHRGVQAEKDTYFGPFASTAAVTRTIHILQRAFLLRTCQDSVFGNRTRPCLLYQIKRCSGPCTNEISDTDYQALVKEAKAFLAGKSQIIQTKIAASMHEAAEKREYEHAALFRDRLSALSQIQTHQGINPQTIEEADVFAIAQEGGMSAIQVFFFRAGQNWGNRSYFPKVDPSIDTSEVLESFIAQFYDNKPIPKLVLVSEPIKEQSLLEEALRLKSGHKVQLVVAQRGTRKMLSDHAAHNAREALGRRLSEATAQAQLLVLMQQTFNIKKQIQRIEVYDNSHIMGTNAVGAMIVAGPEGFMKNQYRKFNIRSKDITPGDDFGMMKEVLSRRFAQLTKVPLACMAPDAAIDAPFPEWPDILLIDGGEGQRKAVQDIIDAIGVNQHVTVIAIAKGPDRNAGRERFFLEGHKDLSLPPKDPVLYFLQRLRDEAHRFAIGTHRAKRKKALIQNPLDEIEGIGPARKKALLRYFGNAASVRNAGIEDLRKVKGISSAMARQIYEYFHEN